MDLEKVKRITEELLEEEAFQAVEYLPGYAGYVRMKASPLVRAILLGQVYLAEVVSHGLADIADRLANLEP